MCNDLNGLIILKLIKYRVVKTDQVILNKLANKDIERLALAGILSVKENLPSCTLNVILFLEQGLEIRTLQPEMGAHPIRIQFLQLHKNFQ